MYYSNPKGRYLKKQTYPVSIFIVIFLLSVPLITPTIQSAHINISHQSLLKSSSQGNLTNISIENISGGLGITVIVRNIGDSDLLHIKVSVNVSRGLFVRLKTSYYEIAHLPRNGSTAIHLSLFGIGLGKLSLPPEITLLLSAPGSVEKKVRIIAMVFGPFTKITGIYMENDAFNGYTLFSPEYSTKTLLINKHGDIVHSWESHFIQGLGVYLLENGDLLRSMIPYTNTVFISGGVTGGVERYNWNGTLLWTFNYSDSQHCLHHDIKMLPNGHILMVAWEYKTAQEAINAGRNPNSLPVGSLWPDHVIEVEPTGSSGGIIVWEWHVWDHLIQDFDATKNNYGVVGQHPELVDINYGAEDGKERADWNHINSIDYNEELDQIILSVHNQHEIWVIDHSTTTEEAAGHSGGNSDKGGDLLYRLGNPQTYRAGESSDQKFFGQHDAQWIPQGYPGQGDILLFNNGEGRPEGQYSSVEEFIPPVDGNGTYYLLPGSAYGPNEPTWIYTADNPSDFFAGYLSGAQRLPNGNTLICDGDHGVFFEVTQEGKMVWTYRNTLPNSIQNQVFKIHCYGPEYPGLKYLT